MSPALASAAVQYIVPPAVAILAALAGRALHALGKYLAAKHDAAKADSAAARAFAASQMLADSAADAVVAAENTFRPTLKGMAADGKLDAAEQKQIKDFAVGKAKDFAKAVAPKVLEAAGLGALDEILGHLVDAAAARLASDSRASMAASAPTPAAASAAPSASAGAAAPNPQ